MLGAEWQTFEAAAERLDSEALVNAEQGNDVAAIRVTSQLKEWRLFSEAYSNSLGA
jgi:hypothetical protein